MEKKIEIPIIAYLLLPIIMFVGAFYCYYKFNAFEPLNEAEDFQYNHGNVYRKY